jgi:hypothetical protein
VTTNDFTNSKSQDGLSVKLWHGKRIVLVGMDADDPEPHFVGFFIDEQTPESTAFVAFRNRLNFSYRNRSAAKAPHRLRNLPSAEAPFQKSRWIQFSFDPKVGDTCRVTKKHFLAPPLIEPLT